MSAIPRLRFGCAPGKPPGKSAHQARRTFNPDLARVKRFPIADALRPHLKESNQIGADQHIHVKPRVSQAQSNILGFTIAELTPTVILPAKK